VEDPIIIVGPGRCGTSCVAGVLYRLGIYLGTRLLGADATNPWGHFEDRDFLDWNEAFLRQKITRAQWTKRVREVIQKRRALGVLWGWKDPRTCNLLGHYLEFFNDPLFVHCTRAPGQIEASVVRAYGNWGWTPENARAMRLRRQRELDRYLPWYQTFEVDFDRLRSRRRETVQRLAQFCGLQEVGGERMQAAIDFIRPASAAA
jgi:hypothetical protein